MLQKKMLRRATKYWLNKITQRLGPQIVKWQIKRQGLKKCRAFHNHALGQPCFYCFSPTPQKCLLLLFLITQGRVEYTLHYGGCKKNNSWAMKVCSPSIRHIIRIKSQMTPRFQQKSVTKGESVFMTTRTRQLNMSFQWFGVFRFCNGAVWKLSSRKTIFF